MSASSEDPIRALTRLAREQEQRLARFAWSCLSGRGARVSREDVEDVLSEAYLRAATRLRREPGLEIEHLQAWFRRVVFFVCLHHARKWRGSTWGRAVVDLESEAESLELLAGRSYDATQEEHAQLQELLDQLEEEDREVLLLAAEGYTSKQIAERSGSTPDAARKRKSRAIRHLREMLKETRR